MEGDVFSGLDVPRGTLDLFRAYANEIIRWNDSVKLVSKKDSLSENSLMHRHIFDSLQIIDFIMNDDVVLDIGSGAGFPGFVIAVLTSSYVTLIEPNYKKAAFLRYISEKFSVRCDIQQIRAEEYRNLHKEVDVITSRAFASILSVVEGSIHNISENTRIILFKSDLQLEIELKEFASFYDFNLQVFTNKINTESKIVLLSKIKLK
jgi:16S rRNA (guanine527-N7)-methyltransferase